MTPRYDANISMLFREHSFLDRFEAAARAGFTGVEFWWPDGEDSEQIAAAARDAGVDVVLINFDGGDLAAGERGLMNDARREETFHANIPRAIALAGSCGCRMLNALVGVELPGVPLDEQMARVRDNLRRAARAAAPAGIRVLVEAINTHDNGPYLVSSTDAAADLIHAVGEPNLGLQYDVFHMHRMGEDVELALRRHSSDIAHVQVADAPGRGEPGTGEIRFAPIMATLDALAYGGWIGLEYAPTGPTEAGLAWLRGAAPAMPGDTSSS